MSLGVCEWARASLMGVQQRQESLPARALCRRLLSPPPPAVFGMVPFLPSILGTMLPMLGMAKQDHMRVVFCFGKDTLPPPLPFPLGPPW